MMLTQELRDYFEAYARSLTAHLRPYRGKLGQQWLGIDHSPRSVLVRTGPTHSQVLVLGKYLGEPCVVKHDLRDLSSVEAPFSDVREPSGTSSLLSMCTTNLGGKDCKFHVVITAKHGLRLSLEGAATAIWTLGFSYRNGLTKNDSAIIERERKRHDEVVCRLHVATPPWAAVLLASTPDPRVFLDPDPLLAGYALAEVILMCAGQRKEQPSVRFARIADELEQVLATSSETNERALQALLEREPWILVPEADATEVLRRPRLSVEEDTEAGILQAELEPDFIYHLHDGESLVVEIEAATKPIAIQRQEATLNVPAAPFTAAAAQILGYRRAFSGVHGAAIRRQLGKPGAWSFRYLLVIGRQSQGRVDQRSWASLRDSHQQLGVDLRTWDYYLDRIRRLARATVCDVVAPTDAV